MNPIDPIALLAFAVLVGAVCFVIGRISTAPTEPKLPPLELSNTARAHIVHEAIRAYERSMGVIRYKSWNNLPADTRDQLVDRMQKLKSGDIVFVEQASAIDRIQQAVASL